MLSINLSCDKAGSFEHPAFSVSRPRAAERPSRQSRTHDRPRPSQHLSIALYGADIRFPANSMHGGHPQTNFTSEVSLFLVLFGAMLEIRIGTRDLPSLIKNFPMFTGPAQYAPLVGPLWHRMSRVSVSQSVSSCRA